MDRSNRIQTWDSLHRIALAWRVLEKTGSATVMWTVLVFTQVPLLIFLLIGGVVVDRFPRLRIMFLSDVLSGTVVVFIVVFSWLDLLKIWHIYIASLIFGFVEAFFFIFSLVWTSTMQEMVRHDKLGRVWAIDSLGLWVLLRSVLRSQVDTQTCLARQRFSSLAVLVRS